MIVNNSSISSTDFIHFSGYFCFMPHMKLGIEREEIRLEDNVLPSSWRKMTAI